jgi:hypothetical protein
MNQPLDPNEPLIMPLPENFTMEDVNTNLQRNTGPTEPPAGPIRLDNKYAGALMGHTVSATEAPRFVYSLTRLTQLVMADTKQLAEDARFTIWNTIQHLTNDFGDSAPVFIDDAAFETVEGEEAPGPQIVGMDGKPIS